jgi:hypothetical protein
MEIPMHRLRSCFALGLALAATAQAQVSLNSVRGDAVMHIAFVVDPEGAHIELIQPARR